VRHERSSMLVAPLGTAQPRVQLSLGLNSQIWYTVLSYDFRREGLLRVTPVCTRYVSVYRVLYHSSTVLVVKESIYMSTQLTKVLVVTVVGRSTLIWGASVPHAAFFGTASASAT
jgi:hypothetical protein